MAPAGKTLSLVTFLALLVLAHAIAGYFDTVSADGRRISPAEQHVHSVLDAAPWVLLGAGRSTPVVARREACSIGRLVAGPAAGAGRGRAAMVVELRQCLRARRQRRQASA